MRLAAGAFVATILLLSSGCAGGEERDRQASATTTQRSYDFPAPPIVIDEPLTRSVDEALARLLPSAAVGILDPEALNAIGGSRDARLGWLVSDLLRFYQGGDEERRLVEAFERLTGVDVRKDPLFSESAWRTVTDHLIAWELPAPPRYRERKAELYTALEPGWKPFFADVDSEIDWRLVAWGGVLIDDRSPGDTSPCARGCIPALDDPALTGADGGAWYPDERLVFGVVVGGEAVAFPKNIMEVHEVVNVTIGGRRLGIPYCTLCRSAQAYLVDSVPAGVEPPVIRTSGLLSRSNKVMYDLRSRSVFDTFTGRALSGPLQDAGVVLEQVTVVSSTWGAWKRAHPETRIVAQDGGIGRSYDEDPLRGRDDDGPIFPIGDADPRLPVQVEIVGVIAPDGRPVAFRADRARAAVASGDQVVLAGVELFADGGGLRARRSNGTGGGEELPAHQAFWFAWSQFHPDTALWTGR
ncbi:MAG: DUF3179 domain-containing protein [Gaiellaceae bacterium MAG52_C11]|nr:DUF3179 domain-containing protein [Candidatus Gaiellasilicea maunaloa]